MRNRSSQNLVGFLTLFPLALFACNKSLNRDDQRSTSIQSGPMESLEISPTQKKLFQWCIHASIRRDELVMDLARMACYGGSPETARLRATAELRCAWNECPQVLTFRENAARVAFRAGVGVMGPIEGSGNMFPATLMEPGYSVFVGFRFEPARHGRSNQCTEYSKMPGWTNHVSTVEEEIRRACDSWAR